jgi:hypothetical protein
MENMNVSMMNAEALESARMELAARIKALPQRFSLNGVDFTWQENTKFRPYTENGEVKVSRDASLRIFPANASDWDHSCEIGSDGAILYYTFHSSSGNNDDDARQTLNYFGICCGLLSENFRGQILRDYREKLETLTALNAEYETISDELSRRRRAAENEKKALAEKETTERRARLEAVGQVWFDYNDSRNIRYTVKNVTDKTIAFDMWRFSENEGRWVSDFAGYTKRVSKHLLGQKPSRRYRRSEREIAVCPVGTNDLQSQKPEQPETVSY